VTGTGPCVFIVGCPRSGTTLLRMMLHSHPDLAIPPESHFIPLAYSVRSRYLTNGLWDVERLAGIILRTTRFREWMVPEERVLKRIRALETPTFADVMESFFLAYADGYDKPRWGDKTPGYSLEIPTLSQLFPQARFVHVVRDGRNVAMSLCEIIPRMSLVEAAAAWSLRVRKGREDGRKLGDKRYMELRYEALVRDPEVVLREVCEFLDLAYRSEMLDFAGLVRESIPERERGIHRNLVKPLTEGLRDWRVDMATGQVALIEAVAGRQLAEFGYERRFRRIPMSIRPLAWLSQLLNGVSHAVWQARRRAMVTLRPEVLPLPRRW
jgi:hypothetical protein